MNYHEAIQEELDNEMEMFNFQYDQALKYSTLKLVKMREHHRKNIDKHCSCGFCFRLLELDPEGTNLQYKDEV